MTPTEIEKHILTELTPESRFPIVILFGSHANGSPTHTSDIDLGFVSAEKLSNDELVETQLKLSRALGKEVDLVDLLTAHPRVTAEATIKGKLLRQVDSSRYAALLTRIWGDQADFEPLRRQMGESLRKKAFK